MATVVLRLYHFFRKHPWLCFLLFLVLSAFLVLQVTRINYKEDISDFLPLKGKNQDALRVYQDISGANNMIAIFFNKILFKHLVHF